MVPRGTLHLVVGPSGAGKDTLIDAIRRARPDILIPRRAITRPADAGGEAHEPIAQDAFAKAAAEGAFLLWWQAHGMSYGIPSETGGALQAGRHVLANVSRTVIAEARLRHAPLRVLLVTAPTEILAHRLAARGRETAEEIAERLSRAPFAAPEGPDVIVIDNAGTPEAGAKAMLAALAPPPD